MTHMTMSRTPAFRNRMVLKIVVIVALAALTTSSAYAHPLVPSTVASVGSLASGGTLFWDGGYVSEGRAQQHNIAYYAARVNDPESRPPDPCAVSSDISNCFAYDLDITQAGSLRVAVDASNRGDCFAFELSDPQGTSRAFPSSCPALGGTSADPLWGMHAYTLERELEVPAEWIGTWRIRVVAGDVSDWAFRVRAGLNVILEPEPAELAPNLRPWLPSEFGFAAPANPDSGSAMDHENPAGPGLESCTETEQEKTTSCLRFSSGVTNVGRGPLFIEFDLDTDSGTQYVFDSDDTPGLYTDNMQEGTYQTYDAGTSEYHPEHGHRHINDMVLYQLFEVSDLEKRRMDPKGKQMGEAITGEKEGYCSIDHGFGDWSSFHQEAWLSAHTQLTDETCQTALALSTGWGDMYRWQRQGQYVSFESVAEADGSMKPGLYVVQVTIDPQDRVVESDEKDNVGYALIRVTETSSGDRVSICERGLGPHPWSPFTDRTEEPFWWTILRSSQAPTSDECAGS